MNKVFLVCPDCYIEQAIREKYGEESFFLTALGTVFKIDEFEYAEEVNQFMINQEVVYMYIVNDLNCTFIQTVLNGEIKFGTEAEHTLLGLYENNKEGFEELKTEKEKAIKLAKLNIYRQAYALLNVAFVGNKIEDGEIILKGLIYDRGEKKIHKMDIELSN